MSFLVVSCGSAVTDTQEYIPLSERNLDNKPEYSTDYMPKDILENRIYVSSSIVPLSSLVKTIGGDYAVVTNIVPAGVSPHGFDLSAKMMADISKSEKVFMIGLEHIDGFLEKAVDTSKQIHLADGMKLIEVEWHDHHDGHSDDEHHEEEEHHEDEHEDEHHDNHGHSDEHHDEETHTDEYHDDEHDKWEHRDEHDHSSDPHVWLGKDNIFQIADTIRDEFSKEIPEQSEYFSQNAENFKNEVRSAYKNFAETTAGKSPKKFIVFHDAYNYLMQSVWMDMHLKVPFSENVLHDTGTAYLAELVEQVQEHNISHGFTEPQFSTGNIKRFANEYGLKLGTLDPLWANPSAGGYIENLKSNLENLAKVYE